MRTPQTCSNTSLGPYEDNSTYQDEGESVASQKTGHSLASSSSFSLQECINEFRARKVHRSSQSNQNTDDDLINQNNKNKHSERISKPCKDGFCYCFTSDSDDFRIYKSDEKKRSRKSETTDEQFSDMVNNNKKTRRRETLPSNSKMKQSSSPRKVTAISKLEESSRNLKAPMIHIIQEIHNNCVVSEVRVNKHKISRKSPPAKRQQVTDKKIINLPNENISKTTRNAAHADRVSEIDSLVEEFQHSSLSTSSKSSDKYGGRLLQKRLSGTRLEYKPRATPPPKPPRIITAVNSEVTSLSTAPSIREAEKILDDFLREKGIPVPKLSSTHKNNRKSFPLAKSVIPVTDTKASYQKPMPSCPSLSEIERFDSEKSEKSCGVIQEESFTWQTPKIRDMLNLDTNSKYFQSNNPVCGPQVGWTVPPKLDIDTVDGAYHNLVANMESKDTPVKSEMPNNKTESQKFILSEQLKNFVSHSPWSNKKSKDKQNIKKSNSFLNSSKNKLLRLVKKKSPSTKNKSIGVQTFEESVTNREKKRLNLQSPPGSYFSNTPTKTSKRSQTEFDFSRTVNSPPRQDKSTQRKLLFPTHNAPIEKPPRKINSNRHNPTYKSYTSDLDKDLNVSKMNQMLCNIRNRLEASDDLAVGTFRDIQRKEAAPSTGIFSYDAVDGSDYQKVYHISAQADVHNEAEPSYSEIEEDSIFITGSPVNENTNGIEHFVVDNDPKAIYAKVNKTPKKDKTIMASFNNAMEQNSPPKFRNFSKTDLSVQSEIFLENLTFENNVSSNRSSDKTEKVHNFWHGDKLNTELNKPEDSYDSVDSFRESIPKEYDTVSYELPDDNTNPISTEKANGNQSTPKKTTHLTKFGLELTSDECLHQTTSCPATPGYLLNDETSFIRAEESMSLKEETSDSHRKSINSSAWRYQTLKNKLRKSIRKSRNFLKNEGKRISNSLHIPKSINLNQSYDEDWNESSLCISNLFLMDDNAPVNDQLAQAVNVCRSIPELEGTPEMIEAERLLLFSSLKKDSKNFDKSVTSTDEKPKGVVVFQSLRIPVKKNNDQELFFNYYYIGVFSIGRQVKSTQSVECINGEAIFRNCNIHFENVRSDSEIRCDIYMLRLRKVITNRNIPSKKKKLSIASTSSDEIYSRFLPHATFFVHPLDFTPYHLIENCQNTRENLFCLHSAHTCKSSIIPKTQNTNLLSDVHVFAEVEQFFPKFTMEGFLNIQDVSQTHSWNLRWCDLQLLNMRVWGSPNDVSVNKPIYTIDLRKCVTRSVKCASREMCARSRSFCLELQSSETPSIYFFSADNQCDLNHWISALNKILEFIADWMKHESAVQ